MGPIKKAQRVAESVIGLDYFRAVGKINQAHCAYRLVISDGLACGRNASVSNQEICLFLDENDRVARAVVGSKGIYNDPEFLALEAEGKTHTNKLKPFDPADYLDSEESIAAFLDEFKDATPAELREAEETVERARARMEPA